MHFPQDRNRYTFRPQPANMFVGCIVIQRIHCAVQSYSCQEYSRKPLFRPQWWWGNSKEWNTRLNLEGHVGCILSGQCSKRRTGGLIVTYTPNLLRWELLPIEWDFYLKLLFSSLFLCSGVCFSYHAESWHELFKCAFKLSLYLHSAVAFSFDGRVGSQ